MIGKPGQGPGELGAASDINVGPDENIMIEDVSNRRYTYFSNAGDFIKSKLQAAESLIIIKNGKTVVERYFGMGGPLEINRIHSLDNVVLASLIGISA